jgi:hypothetical protein
MQRKDWEDEALEKMKFLYATDTSKTSVGANGWSNSTTTPKITQIMDNLHSNYISALMPNDEWLNWLGGDRDGATQEKRQAILAYVRTKLRDSGSYTVLSRLLLDYIIYGNAIADVEWVAESKEVDDEVIPGYIGPRIVRWNPVDVVFNPLARSFRSSPKITRTLMSYGELEQRRLENPEDQTWIDVELQRARDLRSGTNQGTYTKDDFNKLTTFQVEGFGNLYDYLQSGNVEVLEIEGDVYDTDTMELMQDVIITVIDRSRVVRKQTNPSWLGKGYMAHVGWRNRPDSLVGMGPLDNLIGMQYRIDHLENAKADAVDQNIYPPVKIKGNVEQFSWHPGAEIYMDADGDVEPMRPDLGALAIDNEIMYLTNLMEEFAGAPRQAMGIRTPGEKTAFEVGRLENAAGRIFQEKIKNFEINLLEPIMNGFLELARRNLDGNDLVRTMDDDLGTEAFLSVTKEDITAAGKLRPIGARHFAAQAQLMQSLVALSNTPIWQQIQPDGWLRTCLTLSASTSLRTT